LNRSQQNQQVGGMQGNQGFGNSGFGNNGGLGGGGGGAFGR
jgi:hypothetical protein